MDAGVVVPMPTLPVFVTSNNVEVALAVDEAMMNAFRFVSPLLRESASLPHGVVVPTPKLPATDATLAAPVTRSVPLIVVVSVIESPKVVFPSTVNEEADVVESVTEPTEVRLFTKTSPSASMMNFTEPPTDAEKRLLSATAVAGLITKLASNGFASAAPVVHEE